MLTPTNWITWGYAQGKFTSFLVMLSPDILDFLGTVSDIATQIAPRFHRGVRMAPTVIHDRGRGPEIVGTRITVYNLLTSFLDPTATEAEICRIYDLTLEQVAAARAYVLGHPETVLAEHLKIEQKMNVGNPPEVIAQAERAKSIFRSFREWQAEREAEVLTEENALPGPDQLGTFREWLARQTED